jgi:perosamine synthetase
VEGVSLNPPVAGLENSYWMVTAVLDPALRLDKFAVIEGLKARSIASRPFFSPLSSLPAYAERPEAKAAALRNRNGYAIAPYGINLPSGANLDEATVVQICDALTQVIKGE